MRSLIFQSNLKAISDFKTPKELSKENAINYKKQKEDMIFLQKQKLYSLIVKSLPKLRKHSYNTSVPILIGRIRKFKITSRIERGWILDRVCTGPGNGLYGDQASTANYFVVTETGVFGRAYEFGTGYRIPFGAFNINIRNIRKLPADYYDYHWGEGKSQVVAWERINANLKDKLPAKRHLKT